LERAIFEAADDDVAESIERDVGFADRETAQPLATATGIVVVSD
jgi:hypothetical protein